MPSTNHSRDGISTSELDEIAEQRQPSLASELWGLIVAHKAWWMIPILAVMSLVGLLIALGGTGATPFIYSIF